MNTKVNTPLDALGLTANVKTDAGAARPAENPEGASTEFLSLVQAFIDGQQGSAEVDGVRAGQQTREEPEKQVVESKETAAQLMASLLGSSGLVQETPAQPANAELIPTPSSTVETAETSQTVVMPPSVALPAPAQMAFDGTATGAEAGADNPVQTSVPAQTPQPMKGAESPEPVGLGADEAPQRIEPERAAESSAGGSASTAKGAAPLDAGSPRPAEQEAVLTAAAAPETPEAREVKTGSDAARATQPGSDDVRQANAAPASPDLEPARDPSAKAAPASVMVAQATHAAYGPMAWSQAQAQPAGPSGRTPDWSNAAAASTRLQAPESIETPVKPVEKSDRTATSSADRYAPGLLLDSGLTINSKTQPAPVSTAHVQPNREIGAKVINQIVRTAKTHFFEGGAAMTLRLDPPHLGTVRMDVMASGGTVTAVLETTTESARQILQADLGALKEALSQSGVNVDTINVSVNTGQDQGWNPYGRQGEPGNGYGRSNAPWASAANNGADDTQPLITMTEARGYSSQGFDYLA